MLKPLSAIIAILVFLLIPTTTPKQGTIQPLTGNLYTIGVEPQITAPIAVKALSQVLPRTPQDTIERRQLDTTQYIAWTLAGSPGTYTPIEPDPLAVGCSSGAAYYMAYIGSTQNAAATGCLSKTGKVLAVSGLQYKYDAAVACQCVQVFYAPIANTGEIEGTTLTIKYVTTVKELK